MSMHWTNNVMLMSEAENLYGITLCFCPFCGGRNLGLWMGPNPYVTCGSCNADGPTPDPDRDINRRQRMAMLLWNLRGKNDR